MLLHTFTSSVNYYMLCYQAPVVWLLNLIQNLNIFVRFTDFKITLMSVDVDRTKFVADHSFIYYFRLSVENIKATLFVGCLSKL